MPRGEKSFSGPIPKHSSERLRTNKDVVPIETISVVGMVEQPDLGMDDPHPLTLSLYTSLGLSAQSKYYEPSDWEFARYTMHFVDRILKSNQPSAVMLASINTMLTNLLVTEGDRRRVRIEVERENTMGQLVDVAEVFRQRAQANS
jgi:hypothetical protein